MDDLQRNVQDLWVYIRGELPDNLEETAQKCKALRRRKGVDSAANLLRVILTYGVTDLSLKATAAWASSVKLADLSGVGLFYRLEQSREWLSELISTMLNERVRPSVSSGLGGCL